METLESLTEYCKEFIKDHIDGYVGQMVYGSELGYNITEGINADGSCTYSTYMAKQYLKEWWDDAADYFQYEKDNFGENHNPFENPEAFMVCMVIEGVNQLLMRYFNAHDELYNERFELTQEIADEICDFIDGESDIEF